MMLRHMEETQTDGIPVSSWFSSILIPAHECYSYVFRVDWSSHSIHRCAYENQTLLHLYFYGLWMLGWGLISLEFQCKHNTPTLKEIL